MTPEAEAHSRIVSEQARRVAIQATVSRRVDDRVRMLDPAFRDCTHAERVRRLVVFLGEVGALDPCMDEPGSDPTWAGLKELQETLVDLAADVQAWLEENARSASW